MTTSVTCKLDHAISSPLFLAAVLRASFLTDSLSAFAEKEFHASDNRVRMQEVTVPFLSRYGTLLYQEPLVAV